LCKCKCLHNKIITFTSKKLVADLPLTKITVLAYFFDKEFTIYCLKLLNR